MNRPDPVVSDAPDDVVDAVPYKFVFDNNLWVILYANEDCEIDEENLMAFYADPKRTKEAMVNMDKVLYLYEKEA